jgi:hypothetical protein
LTKLGIGFYTPDSFFSTTNNKGEDMGKQKSPELNEDSELMTRLREYTSRFHDLVYSSSPTKKTEEGEMVMSAEEINAETTSLIGLAGEILEIPEREPLEESEMLAICSLLENDKVSDLTELRRIYRRNKEIAI